MRSIILEGPNGSGKSTLGMLLATRLKMPYKHSGTAPDGNERTIAKCCTEQIDWLLEGCIVDRVTPISQPIYNQNLTVMEHSGLRGYLNKMLEKAIVIYCTSEGDFSKKVYYPDGHYEQIVRDKADIRQRYMETMSGIPHIHYDWTKDDIDTLIERINKWNT